MRETFAARFVDGDQCPIVIPKTSPRDPIAQPVQMRAQVTRRLRQVDRTDTRHAAMVGSSQKIEAIFQILLIYVNDVRLQRFPLAGNFVGSSPVESGRKRARLVVIHIAIISSNY